VGDVSYGFKLRRRDWQQMREHIQQTLPEEACGLLGGKNGISQVVSPVANELKSPVRFRMNANEQVQALLKIEDSGLDLLAIYHSHPTGPAHPSQTDLDEFAYPNVPYIIWQLEGGNWSCLAFLLNKDNFSEIPLIMIDNE
jgi:[CysO sulfur-carrier protein]-S-L-cysteine hydrolase